MERTRPGRSSVPSLPLVLLAPPSRPASPGAGQLDLRCSPGSACPTPTRAVFSSPAPLPAHRWFPAAGTPRPTPRPPPRSLSTRSARHPSFSRHALNRSQQALYSPTFFSDWAFNLDT